MKKKVLASLLCASMVATMFAGCGSSNGNGTEKADKKDGGKETITVMGRTCRGFRRCTGRLA